MSSGSITRKDFIKKSGLTLGSFFIVPNTVIGGRGTIAPSDKVTMGFIGCGMLSQYLSMDFMKLTEVQMVAACDVDSIKMSKFQERTNDFYSKKNDSNYRVCRGYHDYEALIARDDIDAVVVCTPDHWHAKISIEAMLKGIDVYCEKPLAHTVEEGRAMVEVTQAEKRVFQTGSMQRSWADFRQACELVRGGYLGNISEVKVNVGGPPVPYDLAKEKMRPELNWNKWIGPASYEYYNHIVAPPYPLENWPLWRSYKEFGGGGVTDWGAHMFDIVQWALGMDESGPVEFIPPTQKGAERGLYYTYANGVKVTHEDFDRGYAVRFIGSEGTLDVSRDFLESSIPGLVDRKFTSDERQLYVSENHYQNFIDCIKSRKKTVADVEIGHRTSTVCNLINVAYELKRPLSWNPEEERFIDDQYANSKLGKVYRKGFELPV